MPPEDNPADDVQPTKEEMLAIDLVNARERVTEAMKKVGELWANNTEMRTPRMADVVSLLDRAASKMRAECKRLDPTSID